MIKRHLAARSCGSVFDPTSSSGLIAALGTAVLLGTIWVPNLALIYLGGCILGLAAGLFMTTNWALGTRLVPPA